MTDNGEQKPTAVHRVGLIMKDRRIALEACEGQIAFVKRELVDGKVVDWDVLFCLEHKEEFERLKLLCQGALREIPMEEVRKKLGV